MLRQVSTPRFSTYKAHTKHTPLSQSLRLERRTAFQRRRLNDSKPPVLIKSEVLIYGIKGLLVWAAHLLVWAQVLDQLLAGL